MRFTLLFFLGVFAPHFLLAQFDPESSLAINERLSAYHNLVQQERFTTATNYVYPALFQLVTRDELVEQLRYNAHHPDLDLQLGEYRSVQIGSPRESGLNTYVEVFYRQTLYVGFKPDAAQDEDFKVASIEMFSSEYGAENVAHDQLSNTLTVTIPKRLLAVKTDATLEWYFMEINEATLPFIAEIIPVGILRSLK